MGSESICTDTRAQELATYRDGAIRENREVVSAMRCPLSLSSVCSSDVFCGDEIDEGAIDDLRCVLRRRQRIPASRIHSSKVVRADHLFESVFTMRLCQTQRELINGKISSSARLHRYYVSFELTGIATVHTNHRLSSTLSDAHLRFWLYRGISVPNRKCRSRALVRASISEGSSKIPCQHLNLQSREGVHKRGQNKMLGTKTCSVSPKLLELFRLLVGNLS